MTAHGFIVVSRDTTISEVMLSAANSTMLLLIATLLQILIKVPPVYTYSPNKILWSRINRIKENIAACFEVQGLTTFLYWSFQNVFALDISHFHSSNSKLIRA